MPPYAVLLATLLASAAFGLGWSRRNGRVRPVADGALTGDDLAALGLARLGERATLVQFSSAFCAPCRATRRILGEVAEMVDGVAYAEVDAESHLDAVRRFDVLRTPTVLVLDRTGRVVVRASGQPRKADVLAGVGKAVSGDAVGSSR
ncbi:MAG TPA: thioredoxin family protein [Mycobacteriales bacterium]|jgi:thiol-disulfide isomerase/thioredoxin|nr:thioredoxin family protein [Mycobacteriales bacterium]